LIGFFVKAKMKKMTLAIGNENQRKRIQKIDTAYHIINRLDDPSKKALEAVDKILSCKKNPPCPSHPYNCLLKTLT